MRILPAQEIEMRSIETQMRNVPEIETRLRVPREEEDYRNKEEKYEGIGS